MTSIAASRCPHGQPWHECLHQDCDELARRVHHLSTTVQYLRTLRAVGTLIRSGIRCANRDGSMVGVELDRTGGHVLQILLESEPFPAGYEVWNAGFPCQDRRCNCYVRIGQVRRHP